MSGFRLDALSPADFQSKNAIEEEEWISNFFFN
jgi:hypothetical protein